MDPITMLRIVWQEGALVAVSKPAGVASQGGDGLAGNNLVDLARAHFKREHVGVLHRLDRNVSGLVLLALDAEIARTMSAQLRDHEIGRRYVAIVRGNPAADSFELDAWLAKDEKRNQTRAADQAELARLDEHERRAFKPALTRVTVIERFSAPLGRCAALEVELATGRSHQIRAHLAHASLPIVGDPKYGVAARGLNRPLLHAHQLAFSAPSGRSIELRDPPPWSGPELRGLRRVERR
jgi:RluA family pseudouridine synthase